MAEFVNSTGKTALLIGVGGIGGNVYLNELRALGYNVTTVDNVVPADHVSIDDVKGVFDVAVICVPNYLHEYFAEWYHDYMSQNPELFDHTCITLDSDYIVDWWKDNSYLYDNFNSPYLEITK